MDTLIFRAEPSDYLAASHGESTLVGQQRD